MKLLNKQIKEQIPNLDDEYDLILGNGFNLDHNDEGKEYSYENILKRCNDKNYLKQFKKNNSLEFAQYFPLENDMSELQINDLLNVKISYYHLQMLSRKIIKIDFIKSLEQKRIIFTDESIKKLNKNAGKFLNFKIKDYPLPDFIGSFNAGKEIFNSLLVMADEINLSLDNEIEIKTLYENEIKIEKNNFESLFAYFDASLKLIYHLLKQKISFNRRLLLVKFLSCCFFIDQKFAFLISASLLNVKNGIYTFNKPYKILKKWEKIFKNAKTVSTLNYDLKIEKTYNVISNHLHGSLEGYHIPGGEYKLVKNDHPSEAIQYISNELIFASDPNKKRMKKLIKDIIIKTEELQSKINKRSVKTKIQNYKTHKVLSKKILIIGVNPEGDWFFNDDILKKYEEVYLSYYQEIPKIGFSDLKKINLFIFDFEKLLK